jgi:hypothetical protein
MLFRPIFTLGARVDPEAGVDLKVGEGWRKAKRESGNWLLAMGPSPVKLPQEIYVVGNQCQKKSY